MDIPKQRRQNRSCDQCRRMKRRCVSQIPQDFISPCEQCSRARSRCTYHFASARSSKLHQRMPGTTSAPASTRITPRDSSQDIGQLGMALYPKTLRDYQVASQSLGESIWNESLSTNSSIPQASPGFALESSRIEVLNAERIFESAFATSLDGDTVYNGGLSGYASRRIYIGPTTSQLLSSTLFRYANTQSNPLAVGSKYDLGPEDGDLDQCIRQIRHIRGISRSQRQRENTFRISFLGASFILDMLSPLFGIYVSKPAIESSLSVLQDVVDLVEGLGVSLGIQDDQRNDGSRTTIEEKLSVICSSLNRTELHSTFTGLCSVLILDLFIDGPRKSAFSSKEVNMAMLLDTYLRQLNHVDTKITRFLDLWTSNSDYRDLIGASWSMLRWLAFSRDIVASAFQEERRLSMHVRLDHSACALYCIHNATLRRGSPSLLVTKRVKSGQEKWTEECSIVAQSLYLTLMTLLTCQKVDGDASGYVQTRYQQHCLQPPDELGPWLQQMMNNFTILPESIQLATIITAFSWIFTVLLSSDKGSLQMSATKIGDAIGLCLQLARDTSKVLPWSQQQECSGTVFRLMLSRWAVSQVIARTMTRVINEIFHQTLHHYNVSTPGQAVQQQERGDNTKQQVKDLLDYLTRLDKLADHSDTTHNALQALIPLHGDLILDSWLLTV